MRSTTQHLSTDEHFPTRRPPGPTFTRGRFQRGRRQDSSVSLTSKAQATSAEGRFSFQQVQSSKSRFKTRQHHSQQISDEQSAVNGCRRGVSLRQARYSKFGGTILHSFRRAKRRQ